jgi:hypothetical protein
MHSKRPKAKLTPTHIISQRAIILSAWAAWNQHSHRAQSPRLRDTVQTISKGSKPVRQHGT